MIPFETQQILVPKSVYIGDRAELRCTFKTDRNLSQNISQDWFTESQDGISYEIQNIALQKTGTDSYNFVISFIPWRTGPLQFPDYELKNPETGETLGLLEFEPVKIVSLIEEKNISTIKGTVSPLLLPGTMYKIYGGIVCVVILLAAVICLIVKHRKAAVFVKKLRQRIKYSKNKKAAVTALNKVEKSDADNHKKAEEIQRIMRSYLENRFDGAFTKTVSSEIFQTLCTALGNIQSSMEDEGITIVLDHKLEAASVVGQIFEQTDVIRYKADAEISADGMKGIFETLYDSIDTLELAEKKAAKMEAR